MDFKTLLMPLTCPLAWGSKGMSSHDENPIWHLTQPSYDFKNVFRGK